MDTVYLLVDDFCPVDPGREEAGQAARVVASQRVRPLSSKSFTYHVLQR